MVSTVRPKASDTPRSPMPTCGKLLRSLRCCSLRSEPEGADGLGKALTKIHDAPRMKAVVSAVSNAACVVHASSGRGSADDWSVFRSCQRRDAQHPAGLDHVRVLHGWGVRLHDLGVLGTL